MLICAHHLTTVLLTLLLLLLLLLLLRCRHPGSWVCQRLSPSSALALLYPSTAAS
jgi:hypothetical protein